MTFPAASPSSPSPPSRRRLSSADEPVDDGREAGRGPERGEQDLRRLSRCELAAGGQVDDQDGRRIDRSDGPGQCEQLVERVR